MKDGKTLTVSDTYTLHDDESVREKLTVMSKWDVLHDDGRNPTIDPDDKIEAFLQLGKTYRLTIVLEEVPTS